LRKTKFLGRKPAEKIVNISDLAQSAGTALPFKAGLLLRRGLVEFALDHE
jgi:hypothetical protein